MTAPASPERLGGHLVVETLSGLGAQATFGVPGIHALAIWEALRMSPMQVYGARTELGAGFAADGYARSTGRPAPLVLSTGPGALNSLTAVMEAASSHVPVIAISSQIPSALVGRGRGYLHELPDQLACFAPLVKHAVLAPSLESIPELLAQAWEIALRPPSGPVYLEIPVDLLQGRVTGVLDSEGGPRPRPVLASPPAAALVTAAGLLAKAERPVIWAGGGVLRAGAQAELRELAERLDAPVATTYMGKGALGDEHPLAAGCGCDEAALQELLSSADVLLCVGTELGAETTGQYTLRPAGRVIHADADPARIGATYPALGLTGDAKLTLRRLIDRLPAARPGSDARDRVRRDARERVRRVRERITAGLESQGRETELAVLATVQHALAPDAISCWDMTILGYWAAPHLRLGAGQQFLYPLGSGTLGYAWPAAIGASLAHPGRMVLAVVGDGGIQYALGELGAAAQAGVSAKLLVVDDGGYGILREYQRDAFGQTTAVELPGVDLVAVARGFGVPARASSPADLEQHLSWALAQAGPAVVVLRARLASARPTA